MIWFDYRKFQFEIFVNHNHTVWTGSRLTNTPFLVQLPRFPINRCFFFFFFVMDYYLFIQYILTRKINPHYPNKLLCITNSNSYGVVLNFLLLLYFVFYKTRKNNGHQVVVIRYKGALLSNIISMLKTLFSRITICSAPL